MATTTTASRRQIGKAGDRRSVVRTPVAALADYARAVERGLSVCCAVDPNGPHADTPSGHSYDTDVHAVVFGSDQRPAGRFNEVVVDHAMVNPGSLPAKAQVWAVGERVQARLLDAGMLPVGSFPASGPAQRSRDSSGRSCWKSRCQTAQQWAHRRVER